MILRAIKKFFKGDDIESFLVNDFNIMSQDLQTLLKRLSFFDNFDGIIVRGVSLPAGSEVSISHSLGVIPKDRLILNQSDGNSVITNGTTDWTDKEIYLKNQGASASIIDVLILR
jgi:hypothetical protein